MNNQATKEIVYVVAGALLDYGDNSKAEPKILLAKRPKHKVMPNSWEFPGGKIEQGETPEQALARELNEEIGITISPQDFHSCGFSSFEHGTLHLVVMLFTCTKWSGEPIAQEHQQIDWANISDIENYDMLESDEILIKQLRNNIK